MLIKSLIGQIYVFKASENQSKNIFFLGKKN
jgi:hypothetical protein